MRKLKIQVQTTIDGYMAGTKGQESWTEVPFTEDVYAAMYAIMESVDCIVLGRNIADEFIAAWESRPEGEPEELIDWINNTSKVVISNTLTNSEWANTVVVRGDIVETVNRLKAQSGKDLIAYGGGTLVSSLIVNNLIDDLHLFVNPIAIGGGMPVFAHLDTSRRFRLVSVQPFDCGITALHHRPHTS
jgi:dihydrofolate reductase